MRIIVFIITLYASTLFAQCNLVPDNYHAKKFNTLDIKFDHFNFVQDIVDEILLEDTQIKFEENVTHELTKAYRKLSDEYGSEGREKLSEVTINKYLQSNFITNNNISALETYYSNDENLHGKLIGNLTYERFLYLPEGDMSFPWLPFVFSLPKGSVAYVCAELNKYNPKRNHVSILFLELNQFEKPKWWQIPSHIQRKLYQEEAIVASNQFQFRTSSTTGTIKDFFSDIPVLNLVTKILDKFAIQIDKPLRELLIHTFSGGIKSMTVTPRGLFITHNAKILFINFQLGTYQYTDKEFPWLNLLSLTR